MTESHLQREMFFIPVSCELPQLFIRTLHIDPTANAKANGSSIVFDVVQTQHSISPAAPNFILAGFNHVSLQKTLTDFHRCVPCPTRQDKTGDLCYGSIKDAFKSLPSGLSVHNCVCLLPTYRTRAEEGKAQTKDVKVWTNKSELSQKCGRT